MLKKLSLVLGLFAICVSSQAGHQIGGQIYWNALGNDQYEVFVEEYRVSPVTTTPSGTWLTVDGTSFTATYRRHTPVYTGCGIHLTTVVVYSTVLTIPPPSSGYVSIVFSHCCASVSSNNINGIPGNHIESKLYLAGRNKSSAHVDMTMFGPWNSANFQVPIVTPSSGQLNFGFHDIYGSSGVVLPYNAGYSINQQTGSDIIQATGYHQPTTSPGSYYVSYGLTLTDTSGAPMSVVQQQYLLAVNPATGSNASPVVTLLNSNVNWTASGTQRLKTTVRPGDVVRFRMNATDIGTLPSGVNQTITFSQFGSSAPGLVSYTPVSPQTGFSRQLSNNIDFEWEVPLSCPQGTYSFFTLFSDDYCSMRGATAMNFEIEVSTAGVLQYYNQLCEGDQMLLSSPVVGANYKWLPDTALSSDSTSITIATPLEDRVYYLKVNDTLTAIYHLEVGANEKPILTQNAATSLALDNPGDFTSHYFYFYGVPYSENDTVIGFQNPGVYHVYGLDASCENWSDSLVIPDPAGLQVYQSMNTFLDVQSYDTLDASSAYSIKFNLGTPADAFGVRYFLIPGMKPIQSGSAARILVTGDDGVVRNISLYSQSNEASYFLLPASTKFTQTAAKIEIVVDAGAYRVPVYRTGGVPFVNNNFSVSNLNGVLSGTTVTDQLIPMVFFGEHGIGLSENSSSRVQIYPQPARDVLFVEGLDNGTHYKVLDVHGRTLLRGYLEAENSIVTSSLVPGMYVLQAVWNGELITHRFVIH